MINKNTLKGLFATLLLATPLAQAAVLDFEGFANGTIIDNEYSSIVNITAYNERVNAFGPAVIFDSTPTDAGILATNTASDPDLIGNFNNTRTDAHNLTLSNDFDPGNILIIQEDASACSATTCSRPDDEGARPAGYISFDFVGVIELLSIDFFDVESVENGTSPNNRIDIWDGNDVFVGTVAYTPNTGGDNLWAQLLFDSAANSELRNIGRVDVYFGGSGALDNLAFNVSPVPVPAAFWLFGTALVGFIGYSRRRTI